MNGCQKARLQMSRKLDGVLPPAEDAALQAHLSACPACRTVWEQLCALQQCLREPEPVPETPVTKAPAAPEPEAYSVDEILREVHGGAPQADSAPTPAAPVYSGARVLERLLEDPEKLASDLDALTRALQGLSDDLRRGAAESREGQVDR